MVIKCADFKPEEFFKDCPLVKNRRGNPAGQKRHYMGITTAFDIETTLLDDIQQSFMYIWQWAFGEDTVVIGRTWDELLDLQVAIREALPEDRWLVVYVHNLSYEMSFLKGVYHFEQKDVFALGSRKVLKADMFGKFELRCSYKLTNMNLKQFTYKMGVKHQKLSGDEFDYSKKRYPWTPIDGEELEYCVNDVLGLVEAVNALMQRDGDNLSTIPLTSTGYVRRNAKRAMRNGLHHSYVYSMLPDYDEYCALKEAFRGGNTHCSRFYAGSEFPVENVHSADRSSSYPAVICNCEYPMSIFTKILPHDLNGDYIARCIRIRHKALLLRVKLINVYLKNRYWGCPYLSNDKCRDIIRPVYAVDGLNMFNADNGRILSADSLETTITDIDLKIISEEYEIDEIVFLEGWYATYKKLPQPLIDEVIKYYKEKTEMKGVVGQEIYYDKAKALLNSLYGMMAQDPCKAKVIFSQEGDWDDELSYHFRDKLEAGEKLTKEDLLWIENRKKEILGKSNQKAFLCFQWGVWVTAWSRFMLELGIKLVHETPDAEFIYCDTDSIKYTGDVDWSKYNEERIKECLESGSYASDLKGVTHYMGVFESEDLPDTGYAYRYFKSLGAKKYAYVEREVESWKEELKIGDSDYTYTKIGKGRTHCTIAGVNKAKGGRELDNHGGLEAFREGFVFRDAGGTQAVFNDNPQLPDIEIDGHKLHITANVAILPSEYTLGITGEYERIIKIARGYLDNPFIV